MNKHWNDAYKYELLLKINNAIVTETTRQGLFKALAGELRNHFHYDRFSIYIHDPDEESVSHFAAADGVIPEGMENDSIRPLDKASIAQLIIKSGRPVIIPDLSSYSYFSSVSALRKAGLTSSMAFPLIARNKVLGTIHFSFRRKPKAFDEWADMLNHLSKQVALAVDNMWAHTRLRTINRNLEEQKRYLQDRANEDYHQDYFVCAAPEMVNIMHRVRLVAETDASVLITGETGTGKDYIAHHIHNLSPFRDQIFVKINCPALVSSLFESELFGHARGAFTGAHSKRIGRLEMAKGGTVFLDEIGDLPVGLQAKLLHVLQDHTFEPVGDSRAVKADFRVIAATNQDLQDAIKAGRFRKDLYYRLATVTIPIPPLRERLDEIPILIKHLTQLESAKTNRAAPEYADDAIELLCAYHWPGNVREIKNLVKRMIVMKPGGIITKRDLGDFAHRRKSERSLDGLGSLQESEKRIIEEALGACNGIVGGKKGAALLLGIPTSTLQYRIKKFKLNPNDYVPEF